jgi:hypothetical protein
VLTADSLSELYRMRVRELAVGERRLFFGE